MADGDSKGAQRCLPPGDGKKHFLGNAFELSSEISNHSVRYKKSIRWGLSQVTWPPLIIGGALLQVSVQLGILAFFRGLQDLATRLLQNLIIICVQNRSLAFSTSNKGSFKTYESINSRIKAFKKLWLIVVPDLSGMLKLVLRPHWSQVQNPENLWSPAKNVPIPAITAHVS